jgi:phosphatidylserine/phosphatidylglycerophosphate/cardiolipin synthase-like enzyme
MQAVKLLIQPGQGITPLVKAIDGAKKSVEIFIFRCDRTELERALANAVRRGVSVTALIASVNRGGAKSLRKLELRLLASGITVARTNDDLLRYHAKLIVIDRRILYLLAFNFTYLDIERSRTFGLIIRNKKLVDEAVRLFEADCQRRLFTPKPGTLLVSPLNARAELAAFIKGAKKELLVYCADTSDQAMIRLMLDRAAAGVDVRIIGRVRRKNFKLPVHKPAFRLHTRTMIRDRRVAFVGSQGLRQIELDARREVGLVFQEPAIVKRLLQTFEEDWQHPSKLKDDPNVEDAADADEVAKKVAKSVVKDMSPVGPALRAAFKDVVGEKGTFNHKEFEEAVKDVVKDAVRDAVNDMVQEAVDNNANAK